MLSVAHVISCGTLLLFVRNDLWGRYLTTLPSANILSVINEWMY